MSFNTPYCDIVCANKYLNKSEVWLKASTEKKNLALSFGRAFLDKHYSCIAFDVFNPPEAIKMANAYLAEDYLEGTLIISPGNITGVITSKRSKAGSVETEVEYAIGKITDAQQDISLILAEYCTKKSAISKIVTRI
jgi:hypothetical protein